jgi:hypothetical protein
VNSESLAGPASGDVDESVDAIESPDALSRGDKGAQQVRRWLDSEIPIGELWETPYGEIPESADPLGLRVRTHELTEDSDPLPPSPFTINDREQVWTPRLAHLVEQTNAGQWNAALDIPWGDADVNPDHVESAVAEVFTWLLQQELVAHHVPATFIPKINPEFLEVKLFLSGKVMDEARHADVCVRRLWINGHGPSATPASTDHGLVPLIEIDDYEQASLLVDILGEGQILDVFKIVHDLSPDPATRQIVLLSRRDEARHVSYGVARLAHRLATGQRNQMSSRSCRRTFRARFTCLATTRVSTPARGPGISPLSQPGSGANDSRPPDCRRRRRSTSTRFSRAQAPRSSARGTASAGR